MLKFKFMKKYLWSILLMILGGVAFAQNSIADGVARFDSVLFEKQIQRAETAIGYIYYCDSNTLNSKRNKTSCRKDKADKNSGNFLSAI